MTPLHLASYSGNENVVRLLLNSAGVQVDATTTENVICITFKCLNTSGSVLRRRSLFNRAIIHFTWLVLAGTLRWWVYC